jgi:FkbM family methyltransferase
MSTSRASRLKSLASGLASVAIHRDRWGVFAETWDRTGFDHAFSVSYSQYVEDLTLINLLQANGAGSYLDIGAHHPDRMSNTRLLYDLGWRGVSVDANPAAEAIFRAKRPEDVFVCALVGVADSAAERPFYIFEESGLSTSDVRWRDGALHAGEKLSRTISVPVTSLAQLMQRFFPDQAPDLLLIDTEGSDHEVLASNDWRRWRPKWVLVETPPGVAQALASPPARLLQELGYEAMSVMPMSTLMRDATTR